MTYRTKKTHLALLMHKRYEDIEQVINILRYLGLLNYFSLKPIEKKSESEVAAKLRDSLLFLNFCFVKGGSMPAAEDMLSNCAVIVNHGNGAKELLRP